MSNLNFGISFIDLYRRPGMERLDGEFLDYLSDRDGALAERLTAARAAPDDLTALDESELLIELAPVLEAFVAELFGIEDEVAKLAQAHRDLDVLFETKRNFVQRQALKKINPDEAAAIDGAAVGAELEALVGRALDERTLAEAIAAWQENAEDKTEALEKATAYCAWAALTAEGRKKHAGGVLFKAPAKLEAEDLIPSMERVEYEGVECIVGDPEHRRFRDAFHLSDRGTDLTGALDQANYCIWCHKQGKDSCSKGLREKQPKGSEAPAPFRDSAFGVKLAGCPLVEKVSEFQKLKADGFELGAAAMILVDNPMAVATGHRICNDCMKACVYQRQEPVNVPEVETRTIKDLILLPWGFEIYSLLTRWNPLNLRRPLPREATGRRILVCGMGPAGFTLAHHLLNDGHTVVGVDGLKIEPLEPALSGVDPDGTKRPFEPVRDLLDYQESLDNRVMAGFGGVAEYGITVRWNKNFLKLVRSLLERRTRFALFGGIRFGGTITLDDAWEMGFDHVALALGAGRPTILDIPNGLARGVRTASDFLMGLQLTGAAKTNSLANLQVKLPAVVIGGGLTAIDTAMEAMAYYPRQVEKFLTRFETLAAEHGEDAVGRFWSPSEREVADEFLAHARAIRAEKEQAQREGRPPRIAELLNQWGGVTIAYRKRLIDSPAYTLNHEEVEKAFEEGIRFAEGLTPVAIETNHEHRACAVHLMKKTRLEDGSWQDVGEVTLPVKNVFVAAGTQPNTVLAREDPAHFGLDGKYFQAFDEDGNEVTPEHGMAKPDEARVLVHKHDDGRFVSFFGDLHPSYSGNVVKAMASANQGHPVVTRVLDKLPAASPSKESDDAFFAKLNWELRPIVTEINRLTPTIIEVVLQAPQAARRFRPGQFYRLQNFETLAPAVDGTKLAMEGLALTGASVDLDKGLISVIVLEMGGSSNLCGLLKPGEPVVLMGPTGMPTEIEAGETVLLAGGGLGNAVLFSIGQAFKQAGSRVLYFAGYKGMGDRYKLEEIEAASDAIVWCCDEAPGFETDRDQDRTYVGNIVNAMKAYATGELGETEIPLSEVDRIIVIGSSGMMAAVAHARHDVLEPYLKPHHFAIGSINSPMQCMLKEICAQCLQPVVDPETGERSYVFSCFNQDQPLDHVDWDGLDDRLRQNVVQEKLTSQWIARCVEAERQVR